MVTHNIEEAVYLSDKVVLLKDSPARIRHAYQVPFSKPRSRAVLANREFNQIVQKIYKDFEIR